MPRRLHVGKSFSSILPKTLFYGLDLFYRKNLECTQCFYRPPYEIIDFHFVKYYGGEKQ